ncbi:MAG: aminodeoxychorismate synthase component I [Chloracidobacterium sp.]|nr:aminodeoxychorismate synthase component I [Chloracidobacterium sp.]
MKPASRDKIAVMQQIDISADELVSALLNIAASETVCILDSCGVNHLGSHLLIAGIEPVSLHKIANEEFEKTLTILDEALDSKHLASIFTISYDLGKKLLGISPEISVNKEPDVFLAQFDSLIVHDYNTGITNIVGEPVRFDSIRSKLVSNICNLKSEFSNGHVDVRSNFTRDEYLSAIETIKELIRQGDTYQTNLTQQLSAKLPEGLKPETIFYRLRRDHPAPFAAFIKRLDSTVVSASPERFFCVDAAQSKISTSPIKGTRPRGETAAEDAALRQALLESTKDRAENTMIVDLLRNDLGRISEYGSVHVEKLCDLEEHPTLFHLVSTISGEVKQNTSFSDILKAVFPCGSITGAPKLSTMRIINDTESTPRGLSMGAIGYYVPKDKFGLPETIDMSVAIRTMVIRDQIAVFNVGGGIVIDSDPDSEYEETLTKAKALIAALKPL